MESRHGSAPVTSRRYEDEGEEASTSSSPTIRALKDIAFGSIAGMVSEVFEYPFDLAKVRLQSQVLDKAARFTGPWHCLRQTWNNEGIRGIYRGLPAPIIGAMAETATLFLTYNKLQGLVHSVTRTPQSQGLSLAQLGLAAGGAGFITSFILTPIELVKCRMQVQMIAAPLIAPQLGAFGSSASSFPGGSSVTHVASSGSVLRKKAASKRKSLPGPFQIVSSTIQESGLRGLWRGHTGTMVRESGGSAAWFALKEAVASFLVSRRPPQHGMPNNRKGKNKEDLTFTESAVSGAVAGGACVVLFYPADTIKSAMQTADELHPQNLLPGGSSARRPNPTFWGTARDMWRMAGLRGLYAGGGMTVARSIPSSALIFVVYDGLMKRFGS